MALRDGSSVLVSRQAVLLTTGIGVGLLTLAYVLGVQVGKQTTALRAGSQAGNGEMKELPAPLAEQLKAFEIEAAGLEKTRSEPKPEEAPAEVKAPEKAETPKAEAKPDPEKRWTQQLVTTTDPSELRRIAARAREAGYETVEVKAGNSVKVRLKGAMTRAEADAAALKLKERGLKPFAVKVE